MQDFEFIDRNSVGDLKDQVVYESDGHTAFTERLSCPSFVSLCRNQCRMSSEYKLNPIFRVLLIVQKISVKKCILNIRKQAPPLH